MDVFRRGVLWKLTLGRHEKGTGFLCQQCDLPLGAQRSVCSRCGSHSIGRSMTRHLRPTKPQPRTAPDDRVARYSAASWGQLRLLWVGAGDAGSPLSSLPPELVAMIARLAAWRPPCWADSRLRWCRAKAKTSPDGIVRVRLQAQFWITGLEFDYNHVTRRFKLSEWRKQDDTAGAWKDTTLVGFWSEAEFLVNASFDKRWRQWFESMCVDD